MYEWMNPAHGRANIVLHILGYTIAIVVIFLLVSGLVWLRRCLVDKRKVAWREEMTHLPDESALDVLPKDCIKVDTVSVRYLFALRSE